MATNLEQADADAMLIVEAFAFGKFDEYLAARQADVSRRIAERYGTGSGGTPAGPIPGVGTTEDIFGPTPSVDAT